MASEFKPKKFVCGRYIQEPNATQIVGREAVMLGAGKALIVAGKKAWALAGERIEKSLTEAGVSFELFFLLTDCTYETLAYLTDKVVPEVKPDVVIGVGGGKVMDMAKATSTKTGLPIITCPTSTATFNCWSAMSVMYHPNHKPLDRIWRETEIDCAIVDTQILVESPAKLFASGIADCFAKYIETGMMMESFGLMNTAADMYTSKILAGLTNEITLNKGEKAFRDVKNHELSQEVEDCVFAVVATTAMAAAANYNNKKALISADRGLKSCAFAHALYYAVRQEFTEECWGYLHGEIVGLGCRAAMVSYGRSEYECKNFNRFLDALEQPRTLRELGIDTTDENMERLVDSMMTVWGKHPPEHRPIMREAMELIRG